MRKDQQRLMNGGRFKEWGRKGRAQEPQGNGVDPIENDSDVYLPTPSTSLPVLLRIFLLSLFFQVISAHDMDLQASRQASK